MRNAFAILSVLSVLTCASCTVGPQYKAPKDVSPTGFGEMNSLVNTNEPVGKWWQEFHDLELNRLINEALTNNLDLQMAALRIRQSRFQRNIAMVNLFPEINAESSYTHSRGSKNVVLPFGNSSGGGQAATPSATPHVLESGGGNSTGESAPASGADSGRNSFSPSPFGQGGLPGATTDLYQVGFDASWEIDVFGGKRRSIEAAGAELSVAEARRRDFQLSLVAELAREYLELRGAQDRLKIARENLSNQNQLRDLTQSKNNVGLAPELDVVRANSQAATVSSTLPPLEADCRRLIHALSILVGKQPNELSDELRAPLPVPGAPPQVPVGLPSQLVKRRADVRAAERQIVAANARIGAAQADLFPKFALVGSAGLDSTAPENLFNWESRYFLISPTVSWRIFDAGRIMGNIGLQRANKEEAVLQYRNVILKAFQEVEDALVMYATEQTRRNRLNQALDQDQQALNLANQSYNEGLSDFLVVLDAERNVLSAEDALAQSNLAVSTDLVALYKSLGGGWQDEPEEQVTQKERQ